MTFRDLDHEGAIALDTIEREDYIPICYRCAKAPAQSGFAQCDACRIAERDRHREHLQFTLIVTVQEWDAAVEIARASLIDTTIRGWFRRIVLQDATRRAKMPAREVTRKRRRKTPRAERKNLPLWTTREAGEAVRHAASTRGVSVGEHLYWLLKRELKKHKKRG